VSNSKKHIGQMKEAFPPGTDRIRPRYVTHVNIIYVVVREDALDTPWKVIGMQIADKLDENSP